MQGFQGLISLACWRECWFLWIYWTRIKVSLLYLCDIAVIPCVGEDMLWFDCATWNAEWFFPLDASRFKSNACLLTGLFLQGWHSRWSSPAADVREKEASTSPGQEEPLGELLHGRTWESLPYHQTGTWRDYLPGRRLTEEEWDFYQRKKNEKFRRK